MPIATPSSRTSTELPASAVPEITSVLSSVTPSLAEAPVSSLIPVTAGAGGAVVSTTSALVSPRLLAGSAVAPWRLPAPSETAIAAIEATVRSALSAPEPVAPTV